MYHLDYTNIKTSTIIFLVLGSIAAVVAIIYGVSYNKSKNDLRNAFFGVLDTLIEVTIIAGSLSVLFFGLAIYFQFYHSNTQVTSNV